MTPAELVALMADAAREFDGLYRAHGGPDATRYADLSARLRTAADALAGVGEDTARLDWLDRKRRYTPSSVGYHDDRYSWTVYGRGKEVRQGYAPDQEPHDTIRKAIDAARAAGEGT